MSLKTIVGRLGGDLYDGGRRASVPAPGHSRADRSVSLLQVGDRIVIHSFGHADWREVRDQLRNLGLLDPGPGARSPRSASSPTPAARLEAARRIWAAGRPLGATLSAQHCRLRGVEGALPSPSALRHGPEAPRSAYASDGRTWPALLAAVLNPRGELTAVEMTYLAPNAQRCERMRLSRKLVGLAPSGCAVRLAAAQPQMLVAEGVFTTLSASRRFGRPGWALTSAGNLRRWRPPAGVEHVLIAADRGEAGEAAAEDLANTLRAHGVGADISVPPAPFGDWNEAESAGGAGKEGGREGAGASETGGMFQPGDAGAKL